MEALETSREGNAFFFPFIHRQARFDLLRGVFRYYYLFILAATDPGFGLCVPWFLSPAPALQPRCWGLPPPRPTSRFWEPPILQEPPQSTTQLFFLASSTGCRKFTSFWENLTHCYVTAWFVPRGRGSLTSPALSHPAQQGTPQPHGGQPGREAVPQGGHQRSKCAPLSPSPPSPGSQRAGGVPGEDGWGPMAPEGSRKSQGCPTHRGGCGEPRGQWPSS